MKRKFILLSLGLALTGILGIGAIHVLAQSSPAPYTSIVQKLAEKFGLKISDVQAVFDEARNARRAEMRTKFLDFLTQSVKDRKLTEAQKLAILAKKDEFKQQLAANREKYKTMTQAERSTTRQAQRQELETWAKQNGIGLKFLFGRFGMRGHWHKMIR